MNVGFLLLQGSYGQEKSGKSTFKVIQKILLKLEKTFLMTVRKYQEMEMRPEESRESEEFSSSMQVNACVCQRARLLVFAFKLLVKYNFSLLVLKYGSVGSFITPVGLEKYHVIVICGQEKCIHFQEKSLPFWHILPLLCQLFLTLTAFQIIAICVAVLTFAFHRSKSSCVYKDKEK